MSISLIQVILAPDLKSAKTVVADVSVEAEYGNVVVGGSVLTLAHHQPDGPYSAKNGTRAPCCAQALIAEHSEQLKAALSRKGFITVLISHFDLDTVGGIARVIATLTGLMGDQNLFTNHESFWRLAEFVDLKGRHRMERAPNGDSNETNITALNAFWAWSNENIRKNLSSGIEVRNVTSDIEYAIDALHAILIRKNRNMLIEGQKLIEDTARLDANSLVEEHGNGILVRCAPAFVNHLYREGRAVVAFNPALGSITMSLADPVEGVSCRALVQELYGPEAGGHDCIAGSPRGKRMTMGDWWAAVESLDMALDGKG